MSAKRADTRMAHLLHMRDGMKKPTPKKLTMRAQTLRVLGPDTYGQVAAGFIMKDTIIIRTGGIAPAPIDGNG
jgi:hypothetical protein